MILSVVQTVEQSLRRLRYCSKFGILGYGTVIFLGGNVLSQLRVSNLKIGAIYFSETVASTGHSGTDWHDL
jgi:hypothetical protein